MNSLSDAFPTGLIQPEGCHRFGMDTLFLAAFVLHVLKSHPPAHVANNQVIELGSGCGAASLALGLSGISVTGLEIELKLIEVARKNAQILGLQKRTIFEPCNCNHSDDIARIQKVCGTAGLIFANPPWYREEAAKCCADKMRSTARAEKRPSYFCNAASRLLLHHGYYCVMLPTNLICNLTRIAVNNRLGMRKILPLAPHFNENCTRLLCLLQKNAADDPILLPPLILHEANGEWTKKAREFCPWL